MGKRGCSDPGCTTSHLHLKENTPGVHVPSGGAAIDINFVGGPYPYLWIGDITGCRVTIDVSRLKKAIATLERRLAKKVRR